MADHWRLGWEPLSLERWHRDGRQRQDHGLRLVLEDPSGRRGWGEMGPLPERQGRGADPCHGEHLQVLQNQLEHLGPLAGRACLEQWLVHMVRQHPCTSFALGSALWSLEPCHPGAPMTIGADAGDHGIGKNPWPTVGLLPAGAPALRALKRGIGKGWRFWKWKIGAQSWHEERPLLWELLALLEPVDGQLRLDANGRLAVAELPYWLEAATDPRISRLEQPPAPTDPHLNRLLHRSARPGLLLALDESLTHVDQVEELLQNPPISQPLLVLKPSQLGDPRRIAQLLGTWPGRSVISTGFEGSLGRAVVVDLARLAAAGGSPAPGLGQRAD